MNPPPAELPRAVLDGPILSSRLVSVTTIWRDGEVVRSDPWGRLKPLPSIQPIGGQQLATASQLFRAQT